MRTRWLLPLLPGLVAGCLPERMDWPTARLEIVDATAPDGTCTDTAAGPEVFVSSRGRCLGLDARGSSSGGDPGLFFRFHYEVPETFDSVELLQSEDGFAFVSPSLLADLPVGVPIRFAVMVQNRDGREAFEVASVILVNEPPVAIAPPPRTLPAGGFPSAPGQPFELALDGGKSFDVDGDEIVFEWSIDGEPAAATVGTALSLTLGVEPARYVVTLRVIDGVDVSAEARTTVTVGTPNLWSATLGRAGRVDTLRETVPGMSGPGAVTVLDPGVAGAVVAWASAAPGSPLQLGRWPAPQTPVVEPSPLALGSLTRLAADSALARIWGIDSQSGDLQLVAWDIDPAGPSFLGSPAVASAPLSMSTSDPRRTALAVDGLGNAFAAVLGSNGIAVTPYESSFVTPSTSLLGGPIRGVAARPGSDEVWVLTDGEAGSSRITVFAAGVETPDFAIDGDFAGMAWAGELELWLGVPSMGVLRVDAERIAGGATIAEATIQAVELPGASSTRRNWEADPETGDLFVEVAGRTVRVSPSGLIAAIEHGEATLVPHAVDRDGALWYSWGGGIERGRMPRVGLSESFAVATQSDDAAAAAPDLPTGGVWLASWDFPALTLVAENGDRLRDETMVLVGGSGAPMPALFGLSVSADGTAAWGLDLSNGTVVSLDLTTAPPAAVAMDVPLLQSTPAALDITGTRAAWIAADAQVGLVDENGFFTGLHAPVGSIERIAAVSGSGSACVVSQPVAETFSLELVDSAGFVAPLDTFVLAGLVSPEIVGASAVPGACWIYVRDASGSIEVLGSLYGAAPQTCRHGDAGTLADAPYGSIAATDPRTVWIATSGGTGGPEVRRLRFPESGCAGTLATQDAIQETALAGGVSFAD